MRALAKLLLLVCVVYAFSWVSADCNPKCGENTCCLRVEMHNSPECIPMLPLNANCSEFVLTKDRVYMQSCPCRENLYCRNSKCSNYRRSPTRASTTSTTEPPTSTI